MNSQNVVHHKPAPPAVSPVIVLDELVKKAVRKEWLELDYGAHWWSNDHAPTIYANSKLIPPLNTFISNRWSELKPILLKRPVAAKKIRLRKPNDESTEDGLQTAEQENSDLSLGDTAVTSDACNQSFDQPETIDLLSLLLNSPPDVKPTKLLPGQAENHSIPSFSASNRLFSLLELNEPTSTVGGDTRTEEVSTAPSMYPSTSSGGPQSSFTYNAESNASNSMVDINNAFPQVKPVKEKDKSLKMKIKLGDCKNKKESSSEKKEVKPKKSRSPKSDAPKKRKRTIKVKYPKSFNLKKCYTKVVRIPDEILKRYTGLTNEDLKSLYSKNKLTKCSSSHKNHGSVKQTVPFKNHASLNGNGVKKIKVYPRNICGSPPGPLSKKPWNLPNAKNKKSINVPSTSSQSNTNNTVLQSTSIKTVDIAHSLSSTPSQNSCLTITTSTEPQSLSSSKTISPSNGSPVELNSLSLIEKLELLKDNSLSIAVTSPCSDASTVEMVNGEVTEPTSDVDSTNHVVEPATTTTPIEQVSKPEMAVTDPMEEITEPAMTVTSLKLEVPESAEIVTAPKVEVPEPAKKVTALKVKVPETVTAPKIEAPEPSKNVTATKVEVPEPVKTVTTLKMEAPEPAETPPWNEIPEPEETVTEPIVTDEKDSESSFTGFDSSHTALNIVGKEELKTVDSSNTQSEESANLNSEEVAASPNASNEQEINNSNVDNKKLENRTKTINGGKNNELLLKMLATGPSKSRPISDYVNGKIIPLGQKHSTPTLAVIIKRKSTEDFPIIAGSLSLAANDSNKDTKKLMEEADENITVKEISSPDHTADVNMNYHSKILVNGFTTKNPSVQKGKHREISPVTDDKVDSTDSNKENTSYERNKLDENPSPPAKKIKTDEHSDENITKSNLKIDLSKMELEQEEVLDKTSKTDVPSKKVDQNGERPVLDLPSNNFENYECITCFNKFLHFNDWRLHFIDYPQCANAQNCL